MQKKVSHRRTAYHLQGDDGHVGKGWWCSTEMCSEVEAEAGINGNELMQL